MGTTKETGGVDPPEKQKLLPTRFLRKVYLKVSLLELELSAGFGAVFKLLIVCSI